MSDALVAALRQNFKSPRQALAALGLDSSILDDDHYVPSEHTLPMSSGKGFFCAFNKLLAEDSTARDAVMAFDALRCVARDEETENPENEEETMEETENRSGFAAFAEELLEALQDEGVSPEGIERIGQLMARIAKAAAEPDEEAGEECAEPQEEAEGEDEDNDPGGTGFTDEDVAERARQSGYGDPSLTAAEIKARRDADERQRMRDANKKLAQDARARASLVEMVPDAERLHNSSRSRGFLENWGKQVPARPVAAMDGAAGTSFDQMYPDAARFRK